MPTNSDRKCIIVPPPSKLMHDNSGFRELLQTAAEERPLSLAAQAGYLARLTSRASVRHRWTFASRLWTVHTHRGGRRFASDLGVLSIISQKTVCEWKIKATILQLELGILGDCYIMKHMTIYFMNNRFMSFWSSGEHLWYRALCVTLHRYSSFRSFYRSFKQRGLNFHFTFVRFKWTVSNEIVKNSQCEHLPLKTQYERQKKIKI